MTTPTLYQPAIPPVVRTAVYVLGLVVGFLSILAMGLAGIFWTDVAPQVVAAAGVAGTATGFLASALGVVYRPTAGSATSVGLVQTVTLGGPITPGATGTTLLRNTRITGTSPVGFDLRTPSEREADGLAADNDRTLPPYTD